MPVTKSARRALRNALRKRTHNVAERLTLKTTIKDFKRLARPTLERLSKAFSIIDKAAKNGLIHPNKAAHLKAQLAKKGGVAQAKPKAQPKTKKKAVKKTAPLAKKNKK